MDVFSDSRTVMTLDAGGTNFVFSALQSGKEIMEPVTLPAQADDLDRSLKNMIRGFQEVESQIDGRPDAISFAFPGPSDYASGVIGNLPNLSSYRGGVALGPMLEEQFGLPVFINNDGNLFTYGEAMGGLLPEVNRKLRENKIPKQYQNLLGITIGTGFGGGIVMNNNLCLGDNSAAGEIWLSRNYSNDKLFSEEGVSIRAIQRSYNEYAPENSEVMTVREIFQIARGEKKGNRDAAVKAFEDMAVVLGEALANAVTLVDGLIVIGGGICGAYEFFLSKAVKHMNGKIEKKGGGKVPRLVSAVYNLENERSSKAFYQFETEKVSVPFSEKEVSHVPQKRLAVGITRLGTSKATALGAYAYALSQL
ncbi:ROK family protein [Aliifodinibius sp. S!AR15-10]|uniref:ROK family protein n=1 Tax=Aliifodinibius sp. S!AR15-10 TaxID=2950437 RepID=UPI00285F9EE1|nr:ROK family protein [Aliifodinibius sp. S!AR15-10]MDR8393968.1 ROK family protein [Aliifodinibius sp. S!AR15-10]